MISPAEIGKVAGLFEGEATFGSTRKACSPSIRVKMTDRDVVEGVAKLAGVRVRGPYWDGNPKHKPLFAVAICGLKAVQWMMTIYKFMGCRRREKIACALTRWRAHRTPIHWMKRFPDRAWQAAAHARAGNK